MRKATLEALKKSIRHWERMRDGKRIKIKSICGFMELEEPDSQFCALCRRFERNCFDLDWCPVARCVGEDDCNHTPWYEASKSFHNVGPDSPEFKKAAAEEVEFLKSLLPENESGN